MLQKRWFKIFTWFAASAFFFLGAAVIISILSPAPSEVDTMKFMSGMMKSMESSTMGLSMSLEGDTNLKDYIEYSANITLPIIFMSFISGLLVNRRRKHEK